MTDAPGVLVLGLGNVLCGDDGAGVVVVHRLLAQYEVPEGVEVLDGGTLGMSLLSLVSDTDDLVLVDAVRADAPPGTLVVVEGDEVVPTVSERLSPHQVGVADLLAAARFLDRYPRRVVVLGVVPETIELGLGRTAAVEASLPALLQRVVEELAARGYAPARRQRQLDGGDDRVLRALGL
jgi:hydrogenase maturation protease